MEPKQRNVAILVFNDVELLDFAGPYEVFSSVRDLHGTHGRLMQVFAVAPTSAPVRCRNGLTVVPEYDLASCPPFDMLVIPGGAGVEALRKDAEVLTWIRERSQAIELLTSVCTGSFVLATMGLPDGTPLTTHWEAIGALRSEFPMLEIREDDRYVDAGPIVTSAGVSAGIDMALHVTARLYGADVARATAIGIEYEYWE